MKSNFKKENIHRVLLILILVTLASCVVSPQRLGFSEAEWSRMDANRQKVLLDNYKQMRASEHSKVAEDKKLPAIQVSIFGGKVMMPPFTDAYNYASVSFAIQQGQCKKIRMQEIAGKHLTEMDVCFKKDVLLLDPSRYDLAQREGSVRFYYSPLWGAGFTYTHIHSTGYVRLQDVSVKIHD